MMNLQAARQIVEDDIWSANADITSSGTTSCNSDLLTLDFILEEEE